MAPHSLEMRVVTRISIEVRAGNLKLYSRMADRTDRVVVVVVVVTKCADMAQVELMRVGYVKRRSDTAPAGRRARSKLEIIGE